MGLAGWVLGARGGVLLAPFVATVFAIASFGYYQAKVLFAVASGVCFIAYPLAPGKGGKVPTWFRAGDASLRTIAVASAMGVVSAAVVIALVTITGQVPVLPAWYQSWPPAAMLLGGAAFALGNSVLEEAVFRGIMLHAVEVDIGRAAAVLGQAVAFGAMHGNGIPGGWSGMVAAGMFGIAMGWLRCRSGGLFAPVLAHVVVDLAIVAWALAVALDN